MSNFILEVKEALSPVYCQHLIKKFNAAPQKQAGRTGAGVDVTKKDSTDLLLNANADWKEELMKISNAVLQGTIAYAKKYPFLLTGAISPTMQDPQTGKPRTITHEDIQEMTDQQVQQLVTSIYTIDNINLQHYKRAKGGYHHWHSEHYPHPSDPQQKSLHRTLLWLIYLNDIKHGGETEFFYQGTKVKPQQGSLVLAPCGFTHTHRGAVPESADKYILASWINYLPAQRMYGANRR